jgi:queuosine precursor transporter
MFDKLLAGVDRALVAKLMLAHIIIIAISNYLVQFKLDVFGYPLAAAAFTFPLVVVLTDLTVRLIGKETGRAVIGLAFVPAIIASILVVMAGGAPESVALRIGFGSGCAYFLSNLLDVYVFQYFREKYQAWYIAPTLSAVVSTFFDTYVFFFTAFAYGANEFMAANWHIVATNQSITKILVSLLVILPAYGILLSYLQKRLSNQAQG